jgi:hypothetical protein
VAYGAGRRTPSAPSFDGWLPVDELLQLGQTGAFVCELV